MACIWEAKVIHFLGNPGIRVRGGFTMQNPVFITWLHLSMLMIFTHHSLFQTKYLLMRVMVRLLNSLTPIRVWAGTKNSCPTDFLW